MPNVENLVRAVILPFLGGILLPMSGCGNGSYPVDPAGGDKLKQARINAYGPSGSPPSKGGQSAPVISGGSQGLARQKSQSGR